MNPMKTNDIESNRNESNTQKSVEDNQSKSGPKKESKSSQFIPEPAGPFSDQKIRNDFIRKVYGILFCQMTFAVICSLLMISPLLRDYINISTLDKNGNSGAKAVVIILLIIGLVTQITVSLVFCLAPRSRTSVPLNYILLSIFTVALSYIVGFICAQNNGENVVIAFVITGVVVLSITLLATTPWFDITHCGLLLFILLIIHIVMGFVVLIIALTANINIRPLYLVLDIFGAFLFSLYLLYDTQLILGNKNYRISPEEYVWASVSLFTDIIMIFLKILRITSNVNN